MTDFELVSVAHPTKWWSRFIPDWWWQKFGPVADLSEAIEVITIDIPEEQAMTAFSETQMGELPDTPSDPYNGRHCVSCRHVSKTPVTASVDRGDLVNDPGTIVGHDYYCGLACQDFVSPVDGETYELTQICEQARSETGACGPEGKLWEPKE